MGKSKITTSSNVSCTGGDGPAQRRGALSFRVQSSPHCSIGFPLLLCSSCREQYVWRIQMFGYSMGSKSACAVDLA